MRYQDRSLPRPRTAPRGLLFSHPAQRVAGGRKDDSGLGPRPAPPFFSPRSALVSRGRAVLAPDRAWNVDADGYPMWPNRISPNEALKVLHAAPSRTNRRRSSPRDRRLFGDVEHRSLLALHLFDATELLPGRRLAAARRRRDRARMARPDARGGAPPRSRGSCPRPGHSLVRPSRGRNASGPRTARTPRRAMWRGVRRRAPGRRCPGRPR